VVGGDRRDAATVRMRLGRPKDDGAVAACATWAGTTAGLLSFLGQYWTEYRLFMANTVVILIPVLLVFLLGRRFFIKGIVLTGLR
jgi:ABC-type glycerol-3-phosphate transport system permease component